MGVRLPTAFSSAGLGNPPGAAEAVLCTTPPINIPLDFAQILLFACFSITVAGATSASYFGRVRRGTTIAGTLVGGNSAIAIAPGGSVFWGACYADTPGAIAGQQYSLTVTMAGASGITSIGEVSLMAIVL